MARDNSPWERQRRQLERKLDRRASYDRILIVSEGSKTEPNYFRCAPWRAKRGRVVRGRRRSGRVAAGHLQGHRYAVQLLWASLL